MTLLITDDRAGFRAAKAGLTDRLQSRMHSSQLDSELARGVPPETTIALALHAERLTRPAACRQLAQTIRRLIAAARPRPGGRALVPLVPLRHEEIRDARPELEALADRLVAAGPVSARGVALVRVLLSDGAGPLYRRDSRIDLRAHLGRALAALEPALNPA